MNTFAVIILILFVSVQSLQFVAAVERNCFGLAGLFAFEIMAFAYLAKALMQRKKKGLRKMKIKDFRKPCNYCFSDVEPGTVFAVDNSIYMAIEPVKEKELGVLANAVNLDTGELIYYFDTDFIQIVEAELCVR